MFGVKIISQRNGRLSFSALVVVVQLLSCVWLCDSWTAASQDSLPFTISQSLLKLISIESVMPSNHLIPLSPPSPPAFNLSQHQGLFQSVGSSHQVAKVASASVLPVNIQDWFPLGWTGLISLLSKGLFKSLLQHYSSRASILYTQLSL